MTGLSRHQPASDETLVRRARDGDMAAFEELVMRHADRLFASLRRFGLDDAEAQEVAQETFLRAWRGLERFEGRSSFFTWLYRIGFNEAHRRLARRPVAGTVVSSDLHPVGEIEDARPGPVARAETEELRAALGKALRQLPADLRAPVLLRDVEGFSTRQAAAILDLGEAAFKSRLHRGRMALRGLLAPWITAS
jgi:RNA polymerase sigma-70 factor (ECF subfamily)